MSVITTENLMAEAEQLYEAGNLVDAALTYKKVWEQEPDNAMALLAWSSIAFERGNLDNAEQLLRMVLSIEPENIQAITKLGSLFIERGHYPQAVDLLSKVNRDECKELNFLNNLAIAYQRSMDPWSAEEVCRKGLEIDPNHGALTATLSKVLYETGQLREALELQKKAAELNPDREFINLCDLAAIYRQMGDLAEAEIFYRQAIELDPENPHLHYCISIVHDYVPDDKHIVDMEELLEKIDKETPVLYNLYFALAKAYDQIGDYEKAFSHYTQGNRLKRKEISFSRDKVRSRMEEIRTTFADDVEGLKIDSSQSGPAPIFILGMPRSGTTLVEQILCSHSDVSAGGEMFYIQELIADYGLSNGHYDKITGMQENALQKMREQYLSKLRRHDESASYITDKAPSNFTHIGLIRMLFPEAKIIHTMRQPEATCFSLYQTLFGSAVNYAYDLSDLCDYYSEYKKHMAFWNSKMPDYIHDVQYEELVENQEPITREILKFCDLSWQESCLEFHKTKRSVRTASAQQVNKPLYKKATDHWQNYEEYLGEFKEALH